MKRREFLKAAGWLASTSIAAQRPSARARANIIFILADELGVGNVSCYGADNFKTPNIDQLASGGIRYTHCYTAPLCGPSAALILTGRYAFRTGATSQDATKRMDASIETMLPGYLKPAGYVTAAIGKWGQLPSGPAEFGFDEHLDFGGGSAIYRTTPSKKEYLPDVAHDFLADFLSRHRGDPFYVHYSLSNLQKPVLATPDSKPDSTDFYSDNITYIDKLVGRLVTELKRLKMRESTLIVFTSDHGTGGVYAGESTIRGRRLAGEKGSMLEGGALVPLIVNWPGTTPAGKVSADLIDSTDFLPTFAELAGAKLPGNRTLDGHSFALQLQDQPAKPRDWIFVELGKEWYVRETGWKLNRSGQLFDMAKSPFEETLVSSENRNPSSLAARERLQRVLDNLNPAAGIMDAGDGSGRHQDRIVHTKKRKKSN